MAWADLLALLLFGYLAWRYVWRLDAFLINDDEGSYLYAAWRIALGELPYRDFLTPQLPAFLMPSGLMMRALGPEVWFMRAVAALSTLGAGLLTWATARRLFGPLVALLAGAALLLQPEVYLAGRSFRSDPLMLLLQAAGVLAFARAVFPQPDTDAPAEPRRPWLALSGMIFGLATMAKLFGPFPLAGLLLWLLVDARQRGRDLKALALDLVATLLPSALAVAAVLGALARSAGVDQVYAAVIGHHTRQGGDKAFWEVAGDTFGFLSEFSRAGGNAVLLFGALAAAFLAWRARDRQAGLFAWQVPTLLVFFLLSREKFPRHMIYLIPALATLLSLALVEGVAGIRKRPTDQRSDDKAASRLDPATRMLGESSGGVLALALALALLIPWNLLDRDHGFRWETGTRKLGDFIALLSRADELVFSDYSELNFYALRPTTFSGASLSAGAAQSGQITWERIHGELAGRRPAMVLVHRSPFAHLAFLQDRPDFEAWLDTRYGPPIGRFQRDAQVHDVHLPKHKPFPLVARFEGGLELMAAAPDRGEAQAGARMEILSAWRAPGEIGTASAAITRNIGITLRLLDREGRQWAQGDAGLQASDPSDGERARGTAAWRGAELSAQRVGLDLPAGIAPGSYDMFLLAYDMEHGSGLDAFSVDGAPLGQGIFLGSLGVADSGQRVVLPTPPATAEAAAIGDRARIFALPGEPQQALDAQFGAVAQLLGADVITEEGGDSISVALYWKAQARTGLNYKATVQVLSPEGQVVAQHDAEPADGAAPTSSWLAGEIIVDRHAIDLPADLPEAEYRLMVALYHPLTGRRIPVSSAAEPEAVESVESDMLVIGALEVREESP